MGKYGEQMDWAEILCMIFEIVYGVEMDFSYNEVNELQVHKKDKEYA